MARSLREEMEVIERHWGLPPCPKRDRLLRILDEMEEEQSVTFRADVESDGGVGEESDA